MSQLTVCLIIFALTIAGYCSGLYSLATIALTSLTALTLTGCLEAKAAVGYFSNSNVIMIAGMCVVAAGFNRTRFCTSLADTISRVSKGSLHKMMLGYVLIGVLLSQFIQSPVVVFGIVAPMLIASAESMGLNRSKVVFPVGVATICTCCTLPFGAGATISAELNGYIESYIESYGYMEHMVGFLDPMKARLPMLVIAIVYFAFFATRLSPDVSPAATVDSGKKAKTKEPLKPFAEKAGIIIFFGDALALMFADRLHLTTWQVCLIGALLMVLCGVLKPKEATAALPMSMLLLIVGALAMAGALSATGAGDMIGGIIATCASIGGNPVGLMILIQAACLSAFMTPMATAAVPYIMEQGGYNQTSMVKQGMLFAVIACIVSVGWIMTLFPIL